MTSWAETAEERKLRIGDLVACGYCAGSGRQPGPGNRVGFRGGPRRCPNCRGRGVVRVQAAF